ncbi:unnamed protein product [Chironomus riparius]|uniref:Uncharacterized protein n=1 Tax=Chironomus riparius TaxID=315576 RepID=A0A9N9WNS5_9DIPT|nr:unnamed protein product [Chironomus riparius]
MTFGKSDRLRERNVYDDSVCIWLGFFHVLYF